MKTLKMHRPLGECHKLEIEEQYAYIESLREAHRRQRYFYNWIQGHLPYEIWDDVTLNFWDLGKYHQVCSIKVVGDPKRITIAMIDFMASLGCKWKFEKNFDETNGTFWYKTRRRIKYTEYEIRLMGAENVDGCEIKKKRKMRTIYVTDCK